MGKRFCLQKLVKGQGIDMITTILSTVIVLGILVFLHETGHFAAAKLCGMRVERFSMGYPPRLFGRKIGDTDYCVSAIPFGGYVKISGMVDESLDKEQLLKEPEPWEYRARPWIQKFTVILAGPVMNILFALIVFIGTAFVYGVAEQKPGSGIGQVMEKMPAAGAGMIAGDKIVEINSAPVKTWKDLTDIIHKSAGKSVTIKWMRNDTVKQAVITPEKQKIQNPDGSLEEVGLIGITPEVEIRKVSFVKSVKSGTATLIRLTKMIGVSLIKLITGHESIKSLGGPIVIAKLAGDSARSGMGTLMAFMAFLSLNLGLLNLLPIPVLDGGHLFFLSIEGVIRREIPIKVKLILQQIGMALLLGLMIFVIYNDILRVFK